MAIGNSASPGKETERDTAITRKSGVKLLLLFLLLLRFFSQFLRCGLKPRSAIRWSIRLLYRKRALYSTKQPNFPLVDRESSGFYLHCICEIPLGALNSGRDCQVTLTRQQNSGSLTVILKASYSSMIRQVYC